MGVYGFSTESAAEAMEWGLREKLKEALRKKFEASSKDVIEEAVKAALLTFESSIKTYRQYDKFQETIEVILTDKRSK